MRYVNLVPVINFCAVAGLWLKSSVLYLEAALYTKRKKSHGFPFHLFNLMFCDAINYSVDNFLLLPLHFIANIVISVSQVRTTFILYLIGLFVT